MLDSTVVVNVLHTIKAMHKSVMQFELGEEETFNVRKVVSSLTNDFGLATKQGTQISTGMVGCPRMGPDTFFVEPMTLEDSIFNYKDRFTKEECATYWRVLSRIRENLGVLHPTSVEGLHGVEIDACERAATNFDIFLEGIKPRLGLEE